LNPYLRNWFINLLFSLIFIGPIFSQSSEDINLKLAVEFLHNEEYDKAISLLEDIFKKNQGMEVYTPLVSAYIIEKRYSEAEKVIGKKLKRNAYDPIFQVDYGYVQILSGAQKKGTSTYRNAIKKLRPVSHDIIALANSFQRRKATDFAIETLNKGKKLTPNYGYQFELGELYYQSGDIESMIEEYLDLIEVNKSYLQNVQNALNTSIYHDLNKAHLTTLNRALIKRIQKFPDEPIYSEMLIWHFLQQKDFKNAIVQTKALDRRNAENGKRFLPLAKNCFSNKEYELAMECYQYLIDMGPSSTYYINARILMTETIKEKIISSPYTKEDLLVLEENYIKTLEDVGKNRATVHVQIGLAEVWAFNLDKSDEAVTMLNFALYKFNLDAVDKALVKMTLANIYLSNNEIWEASLLYAQVEKDFKYEALGDEAKYKNARIFFYTGDYKWAKAQLDILKGSTSKLIANDALRLSLLISDNLAFDTVGDALQMYARASLLYEQQNLDGALQILDSMSHIYLTHNLQDENLYLQYQIYFRKQNFAQCEVVLKRINANFSNDILADESLYRLAELYDLYLDQEDKAKQLYIDLISNYPASIYVIKARERYRNIRGDVIN